MGSSDWNFRQNCPTELSRSQILEKVLADKKFVSGNIRFVVTPRLGSAVLAERHHICGPRFGAESDRTLAKVTRKEAFIALNMVPHLGPVRLRRLLDIFDSPERVLSAKRNELQNVDGLNQALD